MRGTGNGNLSMAGAPYFCTTETAWILMKNPAPAPRLMNRENLAHALVVIDVALSTADCSSLPSHFCNRIIEVGIGRYGLTTNDRPTVYVYGWSWSLGK
jgi:hypothetical protein